MSEPLNLALVRQALEAELPQPRFPPIVFDALVDLIDPLPQAVRGLLDTPITLAIFGAIRAAVIQEILDTNLLLWLAEQLPEGGFNRQASNRQAAKMEWNLLANMLPVFQDMRDQPQAWLASADMTERAVFADPAIGKFNGSTLEAYDAGTLTLRSFLEMQPLAAIDISFL